MNIKHLNNYLKKCIDEGIYPSFEGLKNYKKYFEGGQAE